jgi:tetratricopeptide (TPR) repeat protein
VGAGVLLLALQIMPSGKTASAAAELLPTWADRANAGHWEQVSFTPAETRGGMIVLIAYGSLFAVAIQRLRTIGDVEWMLTVIGWATVGLAAFGLIQYLTSNGLFLWFYEHPYRDTTDVVKGPFDNRNHFAHFVALGCGPLMWWWLSRANSSGAAVNHFLKLRSRSSECASHKLWIGGFAMSIVMCAALMTFSRAGCALLFLVVFVSTVAYLRLGWISKQLAAPLVGIAALVAGALWIHGHEQLAGRLNDYAGGSLDALDQGHARRKIWAANVEGIRHNGLLGSGVGSHRYICPVYLKDSPPTEHTHAESGYLQVLLETGWPGLILLLLGIAAIMQKGFEVGKTRVEKGESHRLLACLVPLATGLTISVLHSFVDFVWYISSCMSLTVVLAACLFRLHALSRESTGKRETGFDAPRWLRWSVAATVLIVGAWMTYDRTGPAVASRAWDAYLCAHHGQREGESSQLDIESLDASIAALENVVRWYPQHARANLRLASAYLQKFEQIQNFSDNAMPVSQLGEAVVRSDFTSVAGKVSGSSGGNTARVARKLRDEWLERTLQFSVAAGETIKAFDADANGMLAGAEAIAAQQASKIVGKDTLKRDGSLTAAQIASAYRSRYRNAYQYLYQALKHTRSGLSACPLQGEGYLLLAELCFLEDRISATSDLARRKRSLVNQALRLRPWDGDVLLVAGKEALFANHLELAMRLWRRSFQSGLAHRERLVDVFIQQQIPLDYVAHQFTAVLDASACELVLRKYESAKLDTKSPKFYQLMAAAARREAQLNGPNAVKYWLLAHKAHVRLAERAAQIECVRKAAAFEPNDIGTRRRLASIMMEQQLYAEAEPHVRWCLRRQPSDRYLQNAVATILDARSSAARKVILTSGQSDMRASQSE